MAEREGFEPSVRLPAQRFSRPSNSTTLAPLRMQAILTDEKDLGSIFLAKYDKVKLETAGLMSRAQTLRTRYRKLRALDIEAGRFKRLNWIFIATYGTITPVVCTRSSAG